MPVALAGIEFTLCDVDNHVAEELAVLYVAKRGRFRQLRNEADYSAYYPFRLLFDSQEAVRAAELVLTTCKRWVNETKERRGQRG